MSTYRPVGYCSSCRRPIFLLSELSAPCAQKYFGTPCNGAVVSALDVQAWVTCPSCPQQREGGDSKCPGCGGCGWVPRESDRDRKPAVLQALTLSKDPVR